MSHGRIVVHMQRILQKVNTSFVIAISEVACPSTPQTGWSH